MSHLEEPKVTEDEEPPTEQDKRKKMVSYKVASKIWENHISSLYSGDFEDTWWSVLPSVNLSVHPLVHPLLQNQCKITDFEVWGVLLKQINCIPSAGS